MTKQEVGSVLINAGTLLLLAPALFAVVAAFMYLVSIVEITTTGYIFMGIIVYAAISISLIRYGKKLMTE